MTTINNQKIMVREATRADVQPLSLLCAQLGYPAATAESWASQKKCKSISLRSNISRKDAHMFYESLGYAKVKEQYTFRKEL